MINEVRIYLSTRRGRRSFTIVATCALLLAYFTVRTFVSPMPAQYQLDFGKAKWIQQKSATSRQAAYFRKTFYVDSNIERAWIQVAATGNYDLYINGIAIDHRSYPCVRLTGLYDIRWLLSQGTNAIALYVASGSFPGPGQIMARVSYKTAGSPAREFYSDSSWRVSDVRNGVVGRYPWYSQRLVDTFWSKAIETEARDRTLQRLDFDPAEIKTSPQAKWIAPQSIMAPSASFRGSFQLPVVRGETWLRIAANGAYDLSVNGRLAVSQPFGIRINQSDTIPPFLEAQQLENGSEAPAALTAPDSGLPGARIPAPVSDYKSDPIAEPNLVAPQESDESVAATRPQPAPQSADFPTLTPAIVTAPRVGSEMALDLSRGPSAGSLPPALVAYNISRWVKTGINFVSIHVRSDSGPALLCLAGRTYAIHGPVTFGTDATWKIVPDASAAWPRNAVEVGTYGEPPWGALPQLIALSTTPAGEELYLCASSLAQGFLVFAAIIVLWLATPLVVRFQETRSRTIAWTNDALLHLPAIAACLVILLLSFDARFPENICFRPWSVGALAGVLLISRMTLFLPHWKRTSGALNDGKKVKDYNSYFAIALCIIVLAGLGVRLHGFADASFAHDEASLARFSQGIIRKGLPYVIMGSYTRWLTTYELVTYPLALFSWLFGPSVSAFRLPALIFGVLTIGLIGWVGYRMADRRTGVLAALIYAFLPSAIAWSRDGFYPSQECFFALLTFWLFYEAIRDPKRLDDRYLKWSALAFLLTYFSWEGSGFILVSLFISMLVMRWESFDWLRDRTVWRWAAVVVTVIIVQLCVRQLVMLPDYLGIGYDLSEVSTPALVFQNRILFKPFYYLAALCGAENRVGLSVIALLGTLAARKRPYLLYVLLTFATLEVCYTTLLPNYAPRYYFQAQPLLVLAAAGSFIYLADAIGSAEPKVRPISVYWARIISVGVMLLVLVLSSNAYLLKLYRLAADESQPPYFERVGVAYKANYRDADLYVAQHLAPGDIVVTREPHVFAYYAKRDADYSTDTLLNSRIYYDAGGGGAPHYIDKWYGLPTLRSFRDLLDLRATYRRAWIIKSNGCRFEYDFSSRMFLERWGQSVLDTSCEEVVVLTGVGVSAGGPHHER